MKALTTLLVLVVGISTIDAANFDITRFDATLIDGTDGTKAISPRSEERWRCLRHQKLAFL